MTADRPKRFLAFDDLPSGDELKVVVCSRGDFDWAIGVIDKLALWGKVPILFSPSFTETPPPAYFSSQYLYCNMRCMSRWECSTDSTT